MLTLSNASTKLEGLWPVEPHPAPCSSSSDQAEIVGYIGQLSSVTESELGIIVGNEDVEACKDCGGGFVD